MTEPSMATDIKIRPTPPLTKSARRRAVREMLWNDHGFLRVGFKNLHLVAEGIWRANQPQPHHLRYMKSELGLRTLINLRGESQKGYYLLEREMCAALDIQLIDFKMFSRDIPAPERIMEAKALFDSITYPAVMHCKSGADRTGITAALYLILKCGVSVEIARKQLSLKYLHIRQGKTGVLDYYFNRYLSDSESTGVGFLDWATDEQNVSEIKSDFLSGRR